LALLWITCSFIPVAVGAGDVRLASQVHDFAFILAGSKARHVFTVRNDLWQILWIDRLDRSCGCTSASCDRSFVLPGQTFHLTADLSAPQYEEDLSSHITLRAHTANRNVQGDYHLLGSVKRIIEFPDSGGGPIRLGSWPVDARNPQASVTVRRGEFPMGFDGLQVSSPSAGISSCVKAFAADEWLVTFRLSPTDELGGQGYPVTFKFVKGGSVLDATVVQQAYVQWSGPVAATPSSLLFSVALGGHIRSHISIASTDSGPGAAAPRIIDVMTSSKNAVAAWSNGAQDGTVFVDYTAPNTAGRNQGEIIVSINERGKAYKLKIGYLAIVS